MPYCSDNCSDIAIRDLGLEAAPDILKRITQTDGELIPINPSEPQKTPCKEQAGVSPLHALINAHSIHTHVHPLSHQWQLMLQVEKQIY